MKNQVFLIALKWAVINFILGWAISFASRPLVNLISQYGSDVISFLFGAIHLVLTIAVAVLALRELEQKSGPEMCAGKAFELMGYMLWVLVAAVGITMLVQYQFWLREFVESGGIILKSADGVVNISQGQAVIAEHGMLGSLVNNGTIPLVLLRVSVLAPKIDPATGLPIIDPATAGREQARARNEMKDACKAETRPKRKGSGQASPSPEDDAEDQPAYLATPAVSTAGWGGDAAHEQRALPKACREE